MTTLAEHIIVAGAENRPLMLEKSIYNSWASRIRLFIKGNKNGRMMLDSIDNGPLVYPTVEENGQTRPKKYSELTEAQQLQDDCDVQATNIILHNLPPDVYALINHQGATKDIWDKGETLYEYYWRFSQLINDMHTIGMTMHQVQVNIKFMNSLPSEWSKFVTDVKLVKSLYTTNYDHQFSNSIQSLSVSITFSSFNASTPQQFTSVYAAPTHHQHHHTSVNPLQQSVSPLPYISLSLIQQSQTEFPQLDFGLVVPTFQQGEDPIECINKVMAFLSAVASRFPPSNNQLRTSSNPRNQATIQDGRVIVQQVQGRQTQSFAGVGNKGIATTSRENSAAGQPRVVKCYNCQGKGYMNSAFQTEDLDAYDSDYDDISSAKAVLMANLSNCDSYVLSEVPYSSTYPDDMINQDVQEMSYSEQTHIDTNSSAPNDLLVLSLVEQMADQVANFDKENQTNKMGNESLTAKLER
ncbi:hypothetical protein Tco_0749963 [Tanacetum coccineum]|uniref:Integrase, catalytic region, zinc finger, CCHC-type, peptidase aspartic, catalytic n=1 Tax=Tanacetum coccineum TaxID=301880 RepID=A0ABQ4Z2M6_9ASTR